MLALKDITKVYEVGDSKVEALRGVSICFRKNEFVSVLGASGCGKTTLLNIIGGLDRYTEGDLVIAGKSTKDYTDSDWDSYRNHSIGFVFQTYNLIMHQSVLANVELALTLSGVSKAERRRRASEMLDRVGLSDQKHKMPNQLSGGQMQRVAIARALVNDPEILLADEPTGALDSENSLQIMELLKEISKDRLIIMVTHNPELAEKYSTRIVRLHDGLVIDDSDPYEPDEGTSELLRSQNGRKTSMSFFTAFNLSLRNLLTKKARTILTCFAGSIGIIGIALILSMSSGFQNYIDKVQEDTLSSYPLSLEGVTVDYSTMLENMAGKSKEALEREEGMIYSNDALEGLFSAFSASNQKNDLASFKAFMESDENKDFISDHVNDIKYSYNLDMQIYRRSERGDIVKVNPSTVMASMMSELISSQGMSSIGAAGTLANSGMSIFSEMIDNQDLLSSQYDVLAGDWPKEMNDIILVVDSNNRISSLALYTLGIRDQSELSQIYMAMLRGEDVSEMFAEKWSAKYEDLVGMEFRVLLPTDFYEKNARGAFVSLEGDDAVEKLYDDKSKGLTLRISGIVRPSESTTATSISGNIGYTPALSAFVRDAINNSEIVKAQKDSKIDVFTGFAFPEKEEGEEGDDPFTDEEKAQIAVLAAMEEEQARMMLAAAGKTEDEIEAIMQYIAIQKASASAGVDISTLPEDVRNYVITLDKDSQKAFLDLYLNDTYDKNIAKLGVTDESDPSAIYIYPKDFSAKEDLVAFIRDYNASMKEDNQPTKVLVYTDYIGIFLSSVSTIIDVISYVLIAFVSISLVVSSIMIGVITYISVLERTKEIGVLRAIGASKRDVSRVFNAETLIVGLVSGVLGIAITLLLIIPLNLIIYSISDIVRIASLPIWGAIGLILISMGLTLISGLIPSGLAAKRDPVIALRTE